MPTAKTAPSQFESIQPDQCGGELRLRLLAHAPYFAGLAPAELAQINRLFHEHGYAPGERIYAAGDPSARLFVLAAGKVKLSRHTLGGQDVLLDILTPGEVFGSLTLLGDHEYPDTAQAMTQVCALGVGTQEFQSILLEFPVVALAVLQTTAARLQAAHETIRQLSAYPVERRIASILSNLSEKVGGASAHGRLLQLPLSRQELAEMAGATVETASRVVSRLEQAGIVRTGRQWIAIADPKRLAEVARER